MLASKYAEVSPTDQDNGPQTPRNHSTRPSVDDKPLPALPQATLAADKENAPVNGNHSRNPSTTSNLNSPASRLRKSLDASAAVFQPSFTSPSFTPAGRRSQHASRDRIDWSEDDPKSPYRPSGFTPQRPPQRAIPTGPAAGSPTKPLPANNRMFPRAEDLTAKLQPPQPQPPLPPADFKAPTPDIVSRLDTVTPAPTKGKKIVSKKGKPCIIRVPPRQNYTRPDFMPLTKEQVDERLQEFQKDGYDTRGYNHWKFAEGEEEAYGHSLSRGVFPDPTDAAQEYREYKEQNKVEVVFPDRRKWDKYVDDLMEAKLAALGVTNAPPPPPPEEQQPYMDMMHMDPQQDPHQSPPFAGLAQSPPDPTSSAMSHQPWGLGSFQSPFSPDNSTQNTSLGALASPAMSLGQQNLNQPRPGNLSRSSTFGQPNMSSFPFTMSSHVQFPGGWNPAHMYGQPPEVRGASPVFSTGMNRAPSSVNFDSNSADLLRDLHNASTPKAFHEGPTPPAQQMSRNISQQQQQQQQQQQGPSSPTPDGDIDMPDAETPTTLRQDNFPGLAYPTPRGRSHRHNISEGLEREVREVDNPQYYPGEYVNDISVNFDFPGPDMMAKKPFGARSAGHRSMLSMASNSSRFNAEAKEFKFKPSQSQNGFSKSMNNAPTSESLVTAHANGLSAGGPSFHADAAAFKPPQAGKFDFTSTAISFSADKLKQDATETTEKEVEKKEDAPADPAKPKIFSNIDTSDIIKPSRKSKAIPIVNPNANQSTPTKADATSAERKEDLDEERRPGPDSSRSKRSRFVQDDGDSVPQFATPTPNTQEELPMPPVVPSQINEPLPEITEEIPSKSLLDDDKLGNQLVDLSDNSWHDPFKSMRRKEPAPRITAEDAVKPIFDEPASVVKEGSKRKSPLPVAPPLEAKDEEKAKDKPIRGAYVPPHKRGSVQLDDKIKENLLAPKQVIDDPGEIDDVMGQLNDGNSDFGIEEGPLRGRSPLKPALEASKHAAPTKPTEPSKNRSAGILEPVEPRKLSQLANQPIESNRAVPSEWIRDQQKRASESPIRKLGTVQNGAVSDWDDVLPSGEEFVPQAQFFDTRVKNLIENAIKKQLEPISRSVKDMKASVSRINADNDMRTMSAHEKTSSDADDEDDIDGGPGTSTRGSRKSERKLDLMRMVVSEAVRNSVPVASGSTDALEREISLRHESERKLEDAHRLVQLNEKEIMLYKESAENNEHKIRSLEDVRKMSDDKVNELTAEIEAMQETLDEYRNSSKKWRHEIDNAKQAREVLSGTIEKMRREIEEGHRSRDEHVFNVEQMRQALTDATANLSRERAVWQNRFDEMTKENAHISTRLEEIQRSRTHLEEEVERLGLQEKLAIKATIALEEARNANSKMEVELAKMRTDMAEHREAASRFERDAIDLQENVKIEAQRVQTLMEADIEVANKRAENTRVEYESRIDILRAELEGAQAHSESSKAHYEKLLSYADGVRKQALEEAAAASNARLQEQKQHFERQIELLMSQQERELQNAAEDKQRAETHLSNSLKLADQKESLLQDRIKHLEDKAQVAQSAAQAAAQAASEAKAQQAAAEARAAQHARSAPTVPAPSIAQPVAAPVPVPAAAHVVASEPKTVLPSAVAERISPQALRESIAVLQEQLQEREGKIDELEAELSGVDKDAPAKLERAETEINWLRELLQVRVDDLGDLVQNLQMERFDRGAARNAAIRIRTNLQMEQQEKERMMRGEPRNGPLPSLQDLSNFASPRAAQLSAAWNNWRKSGQSPMAGVRQALSSQGSEPSSSQRPSFVGQRNFSNEGAASAQNFLSTLIAPPASGGTRRTTSSASTRRPLQSAAAEPQLDKAFAASGPGAAPFDPSEGHGTAPATPPLLAKDVYDQDADETRNYAYPASESGDEHEHAILDEPAEDAIKLDEATGHGDISGVLEPVSPSAPKVESEPEISGKLEPIAPTAVPAPPVDDRLDEADASAGLGESEAVVQDTSVEPLAAEP